MNVPTGYTALDLVGFTDKGQYNSATAYVQNDLVHYGGNIWRCLIDDTTGITPSESANWTIFISEPTNMTEAIIAPLETSPASAAHSAGDQIIYNDVLYKVTAAIAIGDSLTVGTNIATARKIVYQISATESMIAHIEYSTTASQAYAVGDYLLYDWTLYKVTTAITQGGTITTSGGSANVSATTIGAEISSLNSHIAYLDTAKVEKTDLANPALSGTNTTGGTLALGRFFYNNGVLRRATSEIINGASITDSNSEAVGAGSVGALNKILGSLFKFSLSTDEQITIGANSWTAVKSFTPTAIAGYTPVAIVGYDTGSAFVIYKHIEMSTNGKIYYVASNVSNASVDTSPGFYVMYMRNDLV